ncbi:MAG: PEP-utilizing enzyme, partial [Alphaproteobacteria bacterium]
YLQMARALGVETSRMERNADVFQNMVGMIRGQMYYNLFNWYRCLSLLPGFALNRKLMEQMMGVDRALPEPLLARLRPERTETAWGRFADAIRIVKMMLMICGRRLGHSGAVRRFHRRVDLLLGRYCQHGSAASLGELACRYRFLERELVRKWSVPLVNDLFCMLSFGLLKPALVQWADDRDGSLCNGLLVDRGGVISAEPALRIAEMSRLVSEQFHVRKLIKSGRMKEALARIREIPELSRRFESYLDQFGDRCLGELKLESPSLRDDPAPLLQAIAAGGGVAMTGFSGTGARQAAEQTLNARLKGKPLQSLVVRMLLAEARARIRDRENMRFERTRVFGHARRIFLEMGRGLEAAGHLKQSRDIFYLTAEEIFGFLSGTLACPDLIELAAVRKRKFEEYRRQPSLPRRFETSGAAGMEHIHPLTGQDDDSARNTGPESRKSGLGCAPGCVQGAVRIVTNPQTASLSDGEILVAGFTDPGWVTLMAQASGMIIERGSLLSHSAIVARELGIPTVVAVEGATSWLRDGETVWLDGGAGVVRRLNGCGKAEGVA